MRQLAPITPPEGTSFSREGIGTPIARTSQGDVRLLRPLGRRTALAIQDGLVGCMEKEVAVGQKMEIYVQYMGYTREEGPIMLICEFRAL